MLQEFAKKRDADCKQLEAAQQQTARSSEQSAAHEKALQEAEAKATALETQRQHLRALLRKSHAATKARDDELETSYIARVFCDGFCSSSSPRFFDNTYKRRAGERLSRDARRWRKTAASCAARCDKASAETSQTAAKEQAARFDNDEQDRRDRALAERLAVAEVLSPNESRSRFRETARSRLRGARVSRERRRVTL